MLKITIINYHKFLLCSLFSCLAVSGCQTMSAGECMSADWYRIGQQDGNAGQNENIGRRLDSCRENNVAVAPDSVSAYRTGYMQGVRNYCQPNRIMNDALIGIDRINVCPLETQNHLQPFSQAGLRIFHANQRIDQINRDQNRLSDELSNTKTTEKRAWEIRRQQRQLIYDLQSAVIELRQARIMLGTL